MWYTAHVYFSPVCIHEPWLLVFQVYAVRQQAITCVSVDQDQSCHIASLDYNELTLEAPRIREIQLAILKMLSSKRTYIQKINNQWNFGKYCTFKSIIVPTNALAPLEARSSAGTMMHTDS